MTREEGSKQIVIAVSGSREIKDTDYIRRILDYEISEFMARGYEPKLNLGDAIGVDSRAISWARENGIAHEIFFASGPGYERARAERELIAENGEQPCWELRAVSDWTRDGKQAGHMRNSVMLQGADILLAIQKERSPGTQNAIDLAKARSVFIHYWSYPPCKAEVLELGMPASEVSA